VSGAAPPGAAKPIQTVDGRVLGTPRYMAPERIRGDTTIDGRTDLFAAAVVLYETMTGASPFAASTPSASLAAVLERHIDPDSRIDPRLWVEIQRALSKRPYERHASALELASALKSALGETDGSLEASLKRTQPLTPYSMEPVGMPEIPGEQKSIESVVVLPRKRVSSTVWLGAGAGVGVLMALVVYALRSVSPAPSPGAGAGMPPIGAAMVSPSVPAAATAAASATTTATVPSTTAATATATSTATAPATATATPTHNAPHPGAAHPRPGGRARPVATTPGF
jgi:serine/threonine-protein kinase